MRETAFALTFFSLGLAGQAATALPVRVFEVDHAASQAWKRARLACAGIAAPDTVTYVGADLETEPLLDALIRNGFDHRRPAIVSR